ncbi:MAG: hypothetical protein ABH811_02910 [archaeon]
MKEVFDNFALELVKLHKEFIAFLPREIGNFFNFFILVLLVFLYAFIVWKFYRFISKKNILELNLNKYNRSQHPVIEKLFAGVLYFIEYLIILPFIIFLWFTGFTLLLIFLTENLEINTLLVISATIVAAIRMTSYYNEDLAKDLAKLLPFTLLAISITNPNFFDIQRILSHFNKIPGFFNEIIVFLIFIIALEMILRFFSFIFSLFGLEEEPESE